MEELVVELLGKGSIRKIPEHNPLRNSNENCSLEESSEEFSEKNTERLLKESLAESLVKLWKKEESPEIFLKEFLENILIYI